MCGSNNWWFVFLLIVSRLAVFLSYFNPYLGIKKMLKNRNKKSENSF